jgi:large subunit ribosomal protein L2
MKVGDKIVSSRNADIKPGNSMTLRYIPLGTMIHNIELKKGKGGAARALRRLGRGADGEGRRLRPGPPAVGRGPQIHLECHATIGQVSNPDHANISLGKAGARAGSGRARTTAA